MGRLPWMLDREVRLAKMGLNKEKIISREVMEELGYCKNKCAKIVWGTYPCFLQTDKTRWCPMALRIVLCHNLKDT